MSRHKTTKIKNDRWRGGHTWGWSNGSKRRAYRVQTREHKYPHSSDLLKRRGKYLPTGEECGLASAAGAPAADTL